jgi:hypothetical protein
LCDFLEFVKTYCPSLTILLAVICSCGIWIGAVSWGLVALFGLPAFTGWGIAAALGVFTWAALKYVSFEVQNAIEVADDVDLEPVRWAGGRPSFGGNTTQNPGTAWPTAVGANPVMARTVETPAPSHYGRWGGM